MVPANKARHATIVDVAKAANVSVATAGRALGQYGYVRPETRKAVQEAASALHYKKNMAAQSLISGSAKTFGMIVSDISSEFYSNIIKSTVNYCRERGYCILIYDTHESAKIEREALAIFQKHRVDGIIVSPADSRNVDHLREFIDDGGRIVQIDRCIPELNTDTVMLDNREAAFQGVSRLIAAGHRKIAYIGELHEIRPDLLQSIVNKYGRPSRARRAFAPSYQRFMGYLDAHAVAGLPACLDMIGRTGHYSSESAQRAAGRVLMHEPTAMLAADGMMAIGAFRALKTSGMRIPEDVSFVSFDDLDWYQLVDPPVTAIAQPCAQIGEEAARILIQRTEEKIGPVHYEHVRLPGHILMRGSVRAL
nr:LacI family DNA-binding transcriptional regulator [Gluconacetobacter aggeris]